MTKTTRSILSALAVAGLLSATSVALSACNTVAGAGQDVSSAGKDVTNSAVATKRSIQNP